MAPSDVASACFSQRLSVADRHVALGQWASGHVIVSNLLRCAQGAGCERRLACAEAAEGFLCRMREDVAA